jgi:hypothetical protein
VKVFRIDGVLVAWNSGHNDEEAWHCIRRNRTRVLITVSTSSDWRTAEAARSDGRVRSAHQVTFPHAGPGQCFECWRARLSW